LTAIVRPATTTEPLRAAEVAAILKLAAPDPVPPPADESEIHGTVLAAVQAHPDPAVTLTVSASPPAPALNSPGATL
jgi:hypothetical protein